MVAVKRMESDPGL